MIAKERTHIREGNRSKDRLRSIVVDFGEPWFVSDECLVVIDEFNHYNYSLSCPWIAEGQEDNTACHGQEQGVHTRIGTSEDPHPSIVEEIYPHNCLSRSQKNQNDHKKTLLSQGKTLTNPRTIND